MATGQVGFHDARKVCLLLPTLTSSRPQIQILPQPYPNSPLFPLNKKTRTLLVPNRLNATINRLQKTRTIIDADELPALKEAHLAGLRARANAVKKALRKEEERVARERKEDKWQREHAYEELMHTDDGGSVGRSNEQGWDEDDFM